MQKYTVLFIRFTASLLQNMVFLRRPEVLIPSWRWCGNSRTRSLSRIPARTRLSGLSTGILNFAIRSWNKCWVPDMFFIPRYPGFPIFVEYRESNTSFILRSRNPPVTTSSNPRVQIHSDRFLELSEKSLRFSVSVI